MIDPDYALIAGIFFVLLAVISLLAALADKRRPGSAIALTVLGGGMIWWASARAPGGYAPTDVPMIVLEIVGRVLN
ncbi:hypothetical protein ILP92_14895 [Maribius pontilimi]|uniref:50S ribosomal protein L35 n=1 Tax=Palleronia pontilimi TaxID=1964209 RepID=A0A934IIL3_9RHOB|nr:hypothetical protein [Palleronia pontilimi]MBJ3764035.1 hypothetical protein [Palleronia pontilimi]